MLKNIIIVFVFSLSISGCKSFSDGHTGEAIQQPAEPIEHEQMTKQEINLPLPVDLGDNDDGCGCGE